MGAPAAPELVNTAGEGDEEDASMNETEAERMRCGAPHASRHFARPANQDDFGKSDLEQSGAARNGFDRLQRMSDAELRPWSSQQ